MSLTELDGIIRFKVAGQAAVPRWQQTMMREALEKLDSPPEALRFQCRIATDAVENLKRVELANGETLTLHHQARPQFGKNRSGHAYLTATMTYSGDGENYTLRWVGDAVPSKMQEIAVQHDQGRAVKPVTVALDLSKAQITPAWKAHSWQQGPSKSVRSYAKEKERAEARRAAGKPKRTRAKRNACRITSEDLVGV